MVAKSFLIRRNSNFVKTCDAFILSGKKILLVLENKNMSSHPSRYKCEPVIYIHIQRPFYMYCCQRINKYDKIGINNIIFVFVFQEQHKSKKKKKKLEIFIII